MDLNILLEFQQITQKDLSQFLQRTLEFIRTDRLIISKYYNNQSTQIDPAAFARFTTLQQELQTFFESIQQHNQSLTNSQWWDVVELLEQIDSIFASLRNIHRWSRSSLSKFGYDPNIQIDYTLSQNQTLERISQDILQQQDPNNDWYNIAMSNDLSEEEYSIEGGVKIQLSYPKINRGVQLESVMDVIVGEKIYGLDLDKSLKLSNDGGFSDLTILSHKDTVQQSVEILTLLKKNSNPEFPNEGLQTSVAIGGNRALLNFPVIVRQMRQTFATDDSLKNFMVKNIAYEQDNLLISYEVETRLNETYTGQTTLL